MPEFRYAVSLECAVPMDLPKPDNYPFSTEAADGLLMEKEGLSEDDAFARLRKASQVSGRPLRVIAEAVIATLDAS